MEIKIIELKEDYAKIVIKGEDHTYLNLLQHELIETDGVLIAKYSIPHPLKDEAELFIRTENRDPIDVLKEANKKIIKKIDKVISQI